MTTKNRQTGTEITIYNEDGFWTLICEDHESVCEFDTKAQAISFKSAPAEWCSDCQTLAKAAA